MATVLILRKFPTKTTLSIPSARQQSPAIDPMLLVIIMRAALRTKRNNIANLQYMQLPLYHDSLGFKDLGQLLRLIQM